MAIRPDAASVRPPDHDPLGDVEGVTDRDPLAGWDVPGTAAPMASPPPPAWSIIAGTAGFTGLVGLVTGIGADTGAIRRGLSWSLVGAAVAAAALRVWELEPEPATWASRLASTAADEARDGSWGP